MDENELKNSQMTVYEFIDFIDAKTSKFDDPYLNVQLFGDGSGYVSINDIEHDFNNFEQCIKILNSNPYDL
jgi:hypothetical protein